MEVITKYRAADGSEWPTEAEALAREALVEAVGKAVEPLGKVLPPVRSAGHMDLCRRVARQIDEARNRPVDVDAWAERLAEESNAFND